jgi:hypothetical protein
MGEEEEWKGEHHRSSETATSVLKIPKTTTPLSSHPHLMPLTITFGAGKTAVLECLKSGGSNEIL